MRRRLRPRLSPLSSLLPESEEEDEPLSLPLPLLPSLRRRLWCRFLLAFLWLLCFFSFLCLLLLLLSFLWCFLCFFFLSFEDFFERLCVSSAEGSEGPIRAACSN